MSERNYEKHHFPPISELRDSALVKLLERGLQEQGMQDIRTYEITRALSEFRTKFSSFDVSWSDHQKVLIFGILSEAVKLHQAGDPRNPFDTFHHWSFNSLTAEEREEVFRKGACFLYRQVRSIIHSNRSIVPSVTQPAT